MTTPSEIHITIDHAATDDLVDAIIETLDEFTPRFILTAGPPADRDDQRTITDPHNLFPGRWQELRPETQCVIRGITNSVASHSGRETELAGVLKSVQECIRLNQIGPMAAALAGLT